MGGSLCKQFRFTSPESFRAKMHKRRKHPRIGLANESGGDEKEEEKYKRKSGVPESLTFFGKQVDHQPPKKNK